MEWHLHTSVPSLKVASKEAIRIAGIIGRKARVLGKDGEVLTEVDQLKRCRGLRKVHKWLSRFTDTGNGLIFRFKNNVIAIPISSKAFPSLAKRMQRSNNVILRGCSRVFALQNTYTMKHISGWKSKRLALNVTGVIHHVRATSQDWLSVASNFFVYSQSGTAVNAMQNDCIASKQSGLDQTKYNNDIGSNTNAPWSAKICISWIVPGANIPLLAIQRYCSKIPKS